MKKYIIYTLIVTIEQLKCTADQNRCYENNSI